MEEFLAADTASAMGAWAAEMTAGRGPGWGGAVPASVGWRIRSLGGWAAPCPLRWSPPLALQAALHAARPVLTCGCQQRQGHAAGLRLLALRCAHDRLPARHGPRLDRGLRQCGSMASQCKQPLRRPRLSGSPLPLTGPLTIAAFCTLTAIMSEGRAEGHEGRRRWMRERRRGFLRVWADPQSQAQGLGRAPGPGLLSGPSTDIRSNETLCIGRRHRPRHRGSI